MTAAQCLEKVAPRLVNLAPWLEGFAPVVSARRTLGASGGQRLHTQRGQLAGVRLRGLRHRCVLAVHHGLASIELAELSESWLPTIPH